MLTAAQRKDIVALQRKKERDDRRQFLVEGPKLVEELLASGWAVDRIVAVAEWAEGREVPCPLHVVPQAELARVSAMETPNRVLAVARMPAAAAPPAAPAGLVLALDGLQDPGNLGTILRTADWFAVEHVVGSPDCADRFNPKVVQAGMGAVFRVPMSTAPLAHWLGQLPAAVEVAGAFLNGENLYAGPCSTPAVLVLGSEGRGISDAVAARIRRRITIPRPGAGESLNAAIAAALLCAEWRRDMLRQDR